jgi:polyisoprenoid-binding protein YceI
MKPSAVSLAMLATVALAAPAFAQSPASRDPGAVQPGAYAVEPMHTRVLFSVSHMGFTTYYGDFTGVSGSLSLDPAKPAASRVAVSIPTASVSTTNATLDAELKSADWLDAAKYPAITFASTRIEPTGPDTARITGELTLRGVTRPVALDARLHGAGVNPLDQKYTVGFDAMARPHRSDFGVTKHIPLIGDDLEVTISAATRRGLDARRGSCSLYGHGRRTDHR